MPGGIETGGNLGGPMGGRYPMGGGIPAPDGWPGNCCWGCCSCVLKSLSCMGTVIRLVLPPPMTGMLEG